MRKVFAFLSFFLTGNIMLYADNIPVGDLIPVESVQTNTINPVGGVLNPCSSSTNSCTLQNKGCLPKPNGGYFCYGCLSGYTSVTQTNGYVCIVNCDASNDCTDENRECNWNSTSGITCGDCLEGFVEFNGSCKRPCEITQESCGENQLCNDEIHLGEALCVYSPPSNLSGHGAVLCSNSDLSGVCTNYTQTIEVTPQYTITHEVNSIYLEKGWEAYICDSNHSCEYYSAENETIRESIQKENISYVSVQPIDEVEFRKYYPESRYVKIYNETGEGIVYSTVSNYVQNYFVNQQNITSISIEAGYILFVEDNNDLGFFLDPRELPVVSGYDFGANNSKTRYQFDLSDYGMTEVKSFMIVPNSNLDLSEIEHGAVFCNSAYSECYHTTDHLVFKSGDPYKTGLSGDILTNLRWIRYLYIPEGWNAFLCKTEDATLEDKTNCIQYLQNKKFLTITYDVKKIYVKPVTSEKKAQFLQGKEYIELYDRAGFRGNAMIFAGEGIYSTPFKSIQSLKKSSQNVRGYFKKIFSSNIKYYQEDTKTVPYFIENTRLKTFITEKALYGQFYRDIESANDGLRVSFNFHCPENTDCGDGIVSTPATCEEDSDCFVSGSYCDIKQNRCVYYPTERRYYSEVNSDDFNLYPYVIVSNATGTINNKPYSYYHLNNRALWSQITFSISIEWEAYICSDQENLTCVKFLYDSNTPTKTLQELISSANWPQTANIDTIYVQPKEKPAGQQKIEQYIGYREYGDPVNGQNGYVELYSEENFEGDMVILNKWNKNYNLTLTPIKSENIKSIHVVGNIRPRFKEFNSSEWSFLDRHDFTEECITYIVPDSSMWGGYTTQTYCIDFSFENLGFNQRAASVLVSNSYDANGYYVARGMLKNVPDFATKRYLFDTEITEDKIVEEKNQNRFYDASDLVFVVAHGKWSDGNGSSQKLDNNNDVRSYMYNREFGGSIGDAETEWYLTNACQSLGKAGVSSQEAILGYREVFKNGLHGVGGYFKNSQWWPLSDYGWMGVQFWNFIQGIKYYKTKPIKIEPFTIGEAWRRVFYDGSTGIDFIHRYAGYIAPGKCSNYVHGDHFWGTGETKADPDIDFIRTNGFCYFSKSSANNAYFTFDEVIPAAQDSEWHVFTKSELPNPVIQSLTTHFENSEGAVIPDEENGMFSYAETNRKGRLSVKIDSPDFHPDLNDKEHENMVYEYYEKALLFVETNIQPYINDLYIGNVSVSYGLEQEFDYDGNRTNAEIDEIEFAFSYHTGTGFFLERNEIVISYNPVLDKIVSVKTTLDSLQKTTETVDGKKIFDELAILKAKNPDTEFFAAYNLVDGKYYRPAIFKVVENSIEVETQF